MYRRGIFIRVILAFLLLAVIVGGGMAVYRVGWTQGYQTANVVSSSEGIEPGPLVPQFSSHIYRSYYPGFGFPFFGICLGVGLIFLVMFLVGGLLKPWGRWRWAYHPGHGKWGYGPKPPWVREWEDQRKAKSEGKDAGEEPDSEN